MLVVAENHDGFCRKAKSDKVYCADLVVVAVSCFKNPRDAHGPESERGNVVPIDALQHIEAFLQVLLVSNLDEHRCAEFSGRWEQGVVHVEFALNLVRSGNMFNTEHFLNLIEKRFSILEQKGDGRSYNNPPGRLDLDNVLPSFSV